MTEQDKTTEPGFSSLALSEPVHKALQDAGYQTPTPIQAMAIPYLLDGRDIVGQAQTGTGKTAAFAMPLLSRIDTERRDVQVLVLAPTRELAIQVAKGFQTYAKHMKKLNVLPVYGGQDYDIQLRGLKRGAQVVVGTPGRVMDHMRRGTLALDKLQCLVLDEADEMLRMGFIDDVEWILEQTPDTHQTALFSATMPNPIRRIASTHLNDPAEVIIETRTLAAESIRQRYLVVPGSRKIHALIRILEMEDTDGVMVFVKTKNATVEVAERLVAQGYAACALNGDLSQALRERTVNKLKQGGLDIIVATDVAARGLDVDRISHVFNYDIPNDAETYVHRIGRTGRAGRSGHAILFLAPTDKRVLTGITRATGQNIEPMDVPTVRSINKRRVEKFNEKISDTLENRNISFFKNIIEGYCLDNDADQLDVAAAVAHILQGKVPLLLQEDPNARKPKLAEKLTSGRPKGDRQLRPASRPDEGMERYRMAVGETHGVKPSNIVGAIANEAGLDSEHIGRIQIYDDYSTVDLPIGMPRKLRRLLERVWVCDQQLNITKEEEPKKPSGNDPSPFKSKSTKGEHAYPKRDKPKTKTKTKAKAKPGKKFGKQKTTKGPKKAGAKRKTRNRAA